MDCYGWHRLNWVNKLHASLNKEIREVLALSIFADVLWFELNSMLQLLCNFKFTVVFRSAVQINLYTFIIFISQDTVTNE